MEEPEIQPESGPGDEPLAEETLATEEVTETPADDSADGDATGEPAGDDQEAAGTNKVPYDRFYKVNEAKKALAAENAELKRRLQASEPKKPETPKSPESRLKRVLKPAPPGLSTLEQMEYYNLEAMEAHAPEILERWFENKFGMKAEAAAATLSHTTQTTRAEIVQKYETAAKARGLDPRNPQLQNAVGVLMDSGKYASFEAAMDTFRPAQPVTRPAPKPINGKGAEVESVDLGGLSRVRALPRTATEATRLAAQGKRIEQTSVVDILKSMAAKS